jgi:hypothetical protein
MKLSRALALLALMTLPTMVVSAFAQQETDPTWYDPWAPVIARPVTPLPKPVAKKETTATTTYVAQHKVKKTVRDQAQPQPERVQAMLASK